MGSQILSPDRGRLSKCTLMMSKYANQSRKTRILTASERHLTTLVFSWANQGKPPLASEKSCDLPIRAINKEGSSVYKLQATDLNEDEDVRDLGCLISEKLHVDKHYNSVVKIAIFRTYDLFMVLKSENPETFLRANVTNVRPVVETGATVLSPSKKRDIDMLESVQNNST